MKATSFIAVWCKPKTVMNYFHESSWSHYRLMLMLALVYFIQFGLFILSLEKITVAPLLSLDGFKLIVWFFLLVGLRCFVIIYIAVFALWAAAKVFKGQGTLPQTRGAVIWTLISTLPIGFFLLLINFAFRHPNLGLVAPVIRIVSYLGILWSFTFGFRLLFKTMAEIHHSTGLRTFAAVFLGLVVLLVILFAGRSFLF
jgi:hypothetical protein